MKGHGEGRHGESMTTGLWEYAVTWGWKKSPAIKLVLRASLELETWLAFPAASHTPWVTLEVLRLSVPQFPHKW